MWKVQDIPNKDDIYIRISHSFISKKDQLPSASAFLNTPKDGKNLSCDWSEHCTPESSRELIGKQKKGEVYKDPNLFFIWSMCVGLVREKVVPSQDVIHEPIYNNPEKDGKPNNRAHSIIGLILEI